MQRTAYIPVCTPDESFEGALGKEVLVFRKTPPDTPFMKVKIVVTSEERRYIHQRDKAKKGHKSR